MSVDYIAPEYREHYRRGPVGSDLEAALLDDYNGRFDPRKIEISWGEGAGGPDAAPRSVGVVILNRFDTADHDRLRHYAALMRSYGAGVEAAGRDRLAARKRAESCPVCGEWGHTPLRTEAPDGTVLSPWLCTLHRYLVRHRMTEQLGDEEMPDGRTHAEAVDEYLEHRR